MADELIAVLDVGKTLAKLSLWTRSGELVARASRANERVRADAYAALDVAGIEAFLAETLAEFATKGRVGAIVPVGHGAAAAILRDGQLVVPPLDYEEAIPAADCEAYAAQRGSFAETGSPLLPAGLNLGAQLHFLERLHPGLLRGGAQILPWPQYWAWRLSGVAASEVTSLGCHSDLWRAQGDGPSDLARRRGWAEKLAPLARAGDALGVLTEEWVRRTGLPADVKVYCGLHDSNAALLAARGFAEIAGAEATVLSTGTWFVAMRSPAEGVERAALPEGRDCLVNIDAFGKPVPSARFMGGREIELLTGADGVRIDAEAEQGDLSGAVAEVVASGARVLPSFAPGVGPYPRHLGRWIDRPEAAAARGAAVALYAALMTDACLGLIGGKARILVEGRFAAAEVFVRALASLRPGDRIYVSDGEADVAYGALRLLDPALRQPHALTRVRPLDVSLGAYRGQWRRDVEAGEVGA